MNGSASECIDLRVGRVIAITPSQTIVLLERRDATGTGDLAIPLEMGTLVKLHGRVSTVYGMITGLRVPLPSLEPSEKDLRLVELELVGEIQGADGTGFFRRGVSAYPALDEPVYLASAIDLAKVYARPNTATARVGTIHQDSIVPAYILTDELLGKHFSIVGTTGSGKSCVVATILNAVIPISGLLPPRTFGNDIQAIGIARGRFTHFFQMSVEDLEKSSGFDFAIRRFDPSRSSQAQLDHAQLAHLAELVVLQPEQVAKNLLVLRADGLAKPVDFAGGSGEPRHDVGDGNGAGARRRHLDIAKRNNVPILQDALGGDRGEVEWRPCSIDRIDLSAGLELIEVAIHHDSRAAGQSYEIRQRASVVDVGVGDQQKFDVARIKAELVNRVLERLRGVGHAAIKQNVPGRRRDQIGGKPLGADII